MSSLFIGRNSIAHRVQFVRIDDGARAVYVVGLPVTARCVYPRADAVKTFELLGRAAARPGVWIPVLAPGRPHEYRRALLNRLARAVEVVRNESPFTAAALAYETQVDDSGYVRMRVQRSEKWTVVTSIF